MESVSCHQKGLVMGNILWSVDKKIYSDKEDHTLAITGWAITRDRSECDFILYGSGKELSVPEPSRCERADVAKDLKETKDIKEVGNVGFTVKIPEIIKLAEEHEKLQLALRAGDEKEIIWEATAAEVKDFCEESLIEYHIDEEQITQESILTVRGWVVNQLEPDEIFVRGTDGKVLDNRIHIFCADGTSKKTIDQFGIKSDRNIRTIFLIYHFTGMQGVGIAENDLTFF